VVRTHGTYLYLYSAALHFHLLPAKGRLRDTYRAPPREAPSLICLAIMALATNTALLVLGSIVILAVFYDVLYGRQSEPEPENQPQASGQTRGKRRENPIMKM